MEKNRIKGWLDGLRTGERLPKKNQLVILLLAGVLLFVIAIPVPDAGEGGDGETDAAS